MLRTNRTKYNEALVHACSVCITVRVQAVLVLYIIIKRMYAVLKGRQERDILRPPAPVQIAPELPTATALYSGIRECRPIPNCVIQIQINYLFLETKSEL